MNRLRVRCAVVLAALLLVAACAGDDSPVDETFGAAQPSDTEPDADDELIPGETAGLSTGTVARRDLVQTETLAGTLGFGAQRSFPTNTSGIVTALPEEGDVIGLGEVLFEVDNRPVLLMEGGLPQYRPFNIDMDDGRDVQQLESNLVSLGYADGFDLTVDNDFTSVTADVIEAMEEAWEVEETRAFELGALVFASGPVRIASITVELGQSISPQVVVFQVTETDQRITLDLDAEDRALLAEGDEVDIELPDGTIVDGMVDEIASVATRSIDPQSGGLSDPTIEILVVYAGPPPADGFDAAPVDIIVTEEVDKDVLTVPVPALIALAEGGHAVEVVTSGGTRLVPVELGDFVDDFVEITGDVAEGDEIVMAS